VSCHDNILDGLAGGYQDVTGSRDDAIGCTKHSICSTKDSIDETFRNSASLFEQYYAESFPALLLVDEVLDSALSDQISLDGRCDNCFERIPSS
jgi:hypothetical protein